MTKGKFGLSLAATAVIAFGFSALKQPQSVLLVVGFALLALAEISDIEDPIDEDSFYVVSLTGAIGLCEYGEDIDWLFLPDEAPNEDLPLTYPDDTHIKFCPKCGPGVASGARFCGACGKKLN